MAIGLVVPRPSRPPCGTTRSGMPVALTKWIEAMPAAAAISGQSPRRPRCADCRNAESAMPCFFALSIAAWTDCAPTIWP